MRISLDFDGCLAEEGIERGDIGEPKKDALKAVVFLKDKGYELFVLTSRTDFDKIKEWLTRWGFPEMEVTNKKMNAVAYIDNQAIRFTNWVDICRYFG